MPTADFRMPSLGADMDRGTLVEWRVAPGDRVHHGDIVAVIETEKSTLEVEVFQDGVIDELLVEEGAEAPVGAPLARLRVGEQQAPAEPAATIPAATPATPAPSVPTGPPGPPPLHSPLVRHLAERSGVRLAGLSGSGPAGAVTRADVERAVATSPTPSRRRVLASPRARRLARQSGLVLTELRGTGPGGAVLAADVATAGVTAVPAPPPVAAPVAPPAPAAPAGRSADRGASLQRALGALMSRSKREIPHYYASTTIDLAAATAWLDTTNARRDVQHRIVPAALLLHATVTAALAEPSMNGHWVDGELRPAEGVQLGVAVGLRGGGLVAPAIRDAHLLDIDALMSALRDLVTRARQNALRASEMVDPTITVTNLGDLGVDALFGVIYPPQVAIVGFGAITDQPRAVDGMLAIHPTVTATVSADHRASNGRDAARFLSLIDRHLQTPEQP